VSCNTGDVADLVCVSKEDSITKISQIDEKEVVELFGENLAIVELLQKCGESKEGDAMPPQLQTELESVRHFLWLNPERCGLFFAHRVLIVEGLSEQVLINYLLKTRKIDAGSKAVFVLDACGKYNIHRFMNLLGRLRIKHAVLHDLNTGAGEKKKAVHEQLNKFIADSANQSTVKIDTLPKSLEEFLGLDIEPNDRWKASKILLAAQQAIIEEKKFRAFAEKITDLLQAF